MISTMVLHLALIGANVPESTPLADRPAAKTVAKLVSCEDYDHTQAEADLFHAVNAERKAHGLQPVEWDGRMVVFARKHTLRQCSSGMHHSGAGYNENVAMGQPDTQDVMNTWMNSSGHRANILNPGVRRFGGSGFRGRAGTLWTQVFSR